MKVIRKPDSPVGLVFDLDNTLYTNEAYTRFQNDVLEERLAAHLGRDREWLGAELSRLRLERRASGLGATSMANLSLALGIPIGLSVRWREACIIPGQWLSRDPELDLALETLAVRFPLALVTNNPRSVGIASLEALGVGRHFCTVVGLDDTLHSKPDPEPFLLAADRLLSHSGKAGEPAVGARPDGSLAGSQAGDRVRIMAGLISIGDRHDVDLAPALELGMGAILIERVSEVYDLPEVFAGC